MLIRIAIFASLLLALPAWAADLSGKPKIIDGDTLDVAGQRIRLFGVDAPESKQTCALNGTPWDCGKEATAVLTRLIDGKLITCQERDRDRYKRVVAVCYVDGLDINEAIVRQGWALSYRRYSRVYVPAEDEARKAMVGMWRGKFVEPWDWRRHR